MKREKIIIKKYNNNNKSIAFIGKRKGKKDFCFKYCHQQSKIEKS